MSKQKTKQVSKSLTPGFSQDVIDHPTGRRWRKDQQRSAKRRRKSRGKEPAPNPLIPGITEPLTYLSKLPETGVVDEHGKAIRVEVVLPTDGTSAQPVYLFPDRRKIRSLEKKEITVGGFPTEFNRTCATAEEIESLRRERLDFANAHCVKVASDRGAKRQGEQQYRPAMGAAEQCYGLLGLDVTLLLREGAKRGLAVKPWLERGARYGAALLWRVFGVHALADYFHVGNLFDPDGEFGFGAHIQYQTVRALAAAWLTAERDFRRVGPATCVGLHLLRIGVDVHQHARARYEADQTWLYQNSTEEDWRRLKLTASTLKRIQKAQTQITKGKTTVAKEVALDLTEWDASWGQVRTDKKTGKIYVGCKTQEEVLYRNLQSASENQPPVDWVLSDRVTRMLLRELGKDPDWAPLIPRAQRCAKEIESKHYESGFSVSMTKLLLEWEANESDAERKRAETEQALLKAHYDEERSKAQKNLAQIQANNSKKESQLAKQAAEIIRLGNLIANQQTTISQMKSVPVTTAADTSAPTLPKSSGNPRPSLLTEQELNAIVNAAYRFGRDKTMDGQSHLLTRSIRLKVAWQAAQNISPQLRDAVEEALVAFLSLEQLGMIQKLSDQSDDFSEHAYQQTQQPNFEPTQDVSDPE